MQTVPHYEIVIVNDGSTDLTESIIQSYKAHPRIRLFGYPVNRGAPHAYNHGVLHSRGEYVVFLDADDVFLPDYCEKVLNKMETEQADIGFANLFAIQGCEKLTTTLYGQPREPRYAFAFGGESQSFPADSNLLRKMILQAVHIGPRAIYKRSLFLDYGLEDHRLRISHDWLRHIRFLLYGAKCVFVEEPLGYYRFHSEGNSQKNMLDNAVEVIKVLEIVLLELKALLSPEEHAIAEANLRSWRKQFFAALSGSDMRTAQIVSLLIEKKF